MEIRYCNNCQSHVRGFQCDECGSHLDSDTFVEFDGAPMELFLREEDGYAADVPTLD